MKTLVCSDIHLRNKFEPKKFVYLKNLFSQFDQIIINGDFWCVFSDDFSDFFKSPWRHLFPILKSKKTIYVNGNHDPAKYTLGDLKLFCQENVPEYKLQSGKNLFHIIHGHQYLPWTYTDTPQRIQLLRKIYYNQILYFLEATAHFFFGHHAAKVVSHVQNNIFREYAHRHMKSNEYLITGHSHSPEIDLPNHFINDGFIQNGLAVYLVIEDDKFDLVYDKY